MYVDGYGVAQNDTLAMAWWTLAAVSGDARAARNLETLRHAMDGDAIAQAWAVSRELATDIPAIVAPGLSSAFAGPTLTVRKPFVASEQSQGN